MLKRLRTAHPIVFCVLAEVVFLASLFVTDLIFTIVLVLLRADFSALDTYLYSTLQELVGALIAVLFLVRQTPLLVVRPVVLTVSYLDVQLF